MQSFIESEIVIFGRKKVKILASSGWIRLRSGVVSEGFDYLIALDNGTTLWVDESKLKKRAE